MTDHKSLFSRVAAALPKMELPTLGRQIDIPVYVVHNSADPEDYFFIFDFEQFVEQSKSGAFVRPRLKVWAGRDDFNRAKFARSFRVSFGKEFDLARASLSAGSATSGGWFSWDGFKDLVTSGGASFVANVVLLVGLSAGKMVWNALPLPRIFAGQSDETKLENSISEIQSKVDQALVDMDVTIHKELWTHAYKGTSPGRMTGMDKDAWPLPDNVAQHLNDGETSSWW